MRSTWTDERLDDFATHTDRRFDAVDKRFDRVDRELSGLRTEMNARFDSLQRTMIQFGGSLLASFVGLVVAFVLSQH